MDKPCKFNHLLSYPQVLPDCGLLSNAELIHRIPSSCSVSLSRLGADMFLGLGAVEKSVDIVRVVGDEFGLESPLSRSCGKMYFLSSEFQQVLWY